MEPYQELSKEQIEELLQFTKGVTHAKKGEFGPTGKFPMGKLNQDDEGEIKIGITSSNGKVVIDFGKPIHWIGFSPEQAKQIAATLVQRAGDLV